MLALPIPAAPQNSAQGETVFTSNSELVLVPVEVLDGSGRPLHGLKREDFVLKSDGNPQRIGLFEEVQAPPPPPLITAPSVVNASSPSSAPASAPARFSNLPGTGIPQQLFIVAIDTVNTPIRLQSWARAQLIKYLQASPPRQPMEIVAVTGDGLRQVHPFSTDTASLIASIRKVHSGMTRQDIQSPLLSRMDPQGRIDSYSSVVSQLQQRQAEDVAGNVDGGFATLRNFEEIAWAYSGIPGRKTVLWLTTGFPLQQMEPNAPAMFGHGPGRGGLAYSGVMRVNNDLLPAFQRAFTALNKANVMVYPVDVAGLPMEAMWDVSQPPSLYSHPEFNNLSPLILSDRAAESRDGMKELAHRTGGKTCTAGNDVKFCLEQAMAESSDYYLLGFYVPQQNRKLGWHKLKVTVNAYHGEVRARNTYYLRALGTAPEQEQQQDLRGAIDAAVNFTGILFNVQPGVRAAGATAPLVFKISVPAASILLQPGQEKLSFDVISIPLSAQARPLDKRSRIVKLEMNPQITQKALLQGWNLVNSIAADGSIAAVRVVIRDNGTGRIGSVTFPVGAKPAGS